MYLMECVLWGHSSSARDILLLQKRALRIITSSGPPVHCRPLFIEFGVLTVYAQYILNALTLLKQNVGLFGRREELHDHRTRSANNLDIPRCRLSRMDLASFKATLCQSLLSRPLYSLDELSEDPLISN
jgi:hypothetical protein